MKTILIRLTVVAAFIIGTVSICSMLITEEAITVLTPAHRPVLRALSRPYGTLCLFHACQVAMYHSSIGIAFLLTLLITL